jgi:taurine dioxygenase
VIAIRDQKPNVPQFLEAMKIFDEILQHNRRFAVPECPQIDYISNRDKIGVGRVYFGEGYHTNHSNDVEPPKPTALYVVKLPSTGGRTQFVNMYEAYDELPEQMNKRIDGLPARHLLSKQIQRAKAPEPYGTAGKIASGSFIRSSERIRAQAESRSTSIQSLSQRLSECRNRKRGVWR